MQFCTVSLQNWCKRSVFTRSTGCCFEPVATGFYRSGSERFSFFRRLELQLKVQSFPVQSSLSPVFFRSYRPDFKTLSSGNGWVQRNHFNRVTHCHIGLSEILKNHTPLYNSYSETPPP